MSKSLLFFIFSMAFLAPIIVYIIEKTFNIDIPIIKTVGLEEKFKEIKDDYNIQPIEEEIRSLGNKILE